MQKQKNQELAIQQTSKLFYKKWLYKIELSVTAWFIFKRHHAVQMILSRTAPEHCLDTCNLALANTLSGLSPDEYHYRAYSGKVFLFLNCGVMFEKLLSKFKNIVINAYSPGSSAELLQDTCRVLVVKSLPYNTYTYKIQLKFTKTPDDIKRNFIDWVDSQSSLVKLANSAKRTILCRKYHTSAYTMYTSSEQLITLMQIKYGNIISEVYTYALVDK